MEKTMALLVSLLLSCGIWAQQEGSIKLENVRFDHRGDNVYVEMDMPLRNYYVHDGSSLLLIPAIKSDAKEISLPKVILGEIITGKDGSVGIYAMQALNHRSNLHYNVNIPYEPWMDNAKLILKKELGESGYIQTEILKNSMGKGLNRELPDKQPRPTFTHQLKETTTPTSSTEISTGNLYTKIVDLHYPGMLSTSVLHMPANQSKIEEICNTINNIIRSDEYQLVGIYLTGYTSPQGIFYDNEQVAKRRVRSFQSYLQKYYSYPAIYFNASWIGEDWQGLVDMISKDPDVPSKEEILSIIENVGVFKGREKQLMMLKRGDPYRYIKKHFFTELQRLECKIIYKTK